MSGLADQTIGKAENAIDKAKAEFQNMLKNKKYWGMLFLCLVILFLVWMISLYIRGKLTLLQRNNDEMIAGYKEIGSTQISGVNSGNSNHKHKLRDYYVASSYNSCCGGNSQKDWVDVIPLRETIKRGARLLDFEIYAMNGEPVVAAGPGPSTSGKYCLKGTYNHLSFKKAMQAVKQHAFNGAECPNPDDPLFLSFRVKTVNRNIYDRMAKELASAFPGKFLHSKYGYNGKNILNGKDVIPNIPLLNLRNKVIVMVQDPTNNFKNTPFEEYVNMSGKGKDGVGMPFAQFHRNIEIVQSYDPVSLTNENKKYLSITMPDFTQVSSNPPAPIHHKFGCQFVMMHYNIIDEKLRYYLNFFKQRGSAFRLKPDHLRYFEKVIKLPKDQDKRMSYGPTQANLLGGAYRPAM